MEKSDYTTFRKKLGSRVRAYRTLQGLSLRKLGLMAGIDYAYLLKIESGTVNTTIDTLLKICDALDIDISSLFTDNVVDRNLE